ncbi:hypothetical protein [Methanoregula sp.]|uniref:hypothetical protein n=1 Tax=Methanoregula sp. TaxID=2052170 RepID=UPI002CECA310|nr:hypothetical protein [Methanoregula sp.]HVP97008.1 hypothetical protein [Methanoregula sp.]
MGSVFVSPLNWGLGHASRDVPVIRELLSRGHHVTVGTSGNALAFLKKECPECTFIPFEDYPVPHNNGRIFLPTYTAYIPTLIDAYVSERKKAEKIFSENHYDLIISDSRSGVFSEHIPSIQITHQLHQSLPLIAWPLELLGVYLQADAFSRFTRIVIPDNPTDQDALAGKLSRSLISGINDRLYYCGVLASTRKEPVEKDIDYLIVISGMEPQRTALEKILLQQVSCLPGKKVVLLGKPAQNQKKILEDGTEVFSFISSQEKSQFLSRARFIICRSGYTSMMDIAEAGLKKGLFIPTPGQWEQEYLSRYYHERGWFYSRSQYGIRLSRDIQKADSFSGFPSMSSTRENVRRLYRSVLAEYL